MPPRDTRSRLAHLRARLQRRKAERLASPPRPPADIDAVMAGYGDLFARLAAEAAPDGVPASVVADPPPDADPPGSVTAVLAKYGRLFQWLANRARSEADPPPTKRRDNAPTL